MELKHRDNMPETPDAKDMTVQETSSSTLREAVRATREFANQTITSAKVRFNKNRFRCYVEEFLCFCVGPLTLLFSRPKVNSPFAEDKLQAADGAVEKLIHGTSRKLC